MTCDINTDSISSNLESNRNTKNQRIFLVRLLIDSEITLSTNENDLNSIRCSKCGFPLKFKSLITEVDRKKTHVCQICKREKRLNILLISSYVFFGIVFVAGIIGVIIDQITLDVCLMIGCLEIIFLLFFGRFLEEAIFFGLTQKEKILAALYRFSISAELQAFDVAINYLKKFSFLEDSELIEGFLQVTIYQAKNLPVDWFIELGSFMQKDTKEIIRLLSSYITENNSWLSQIIIEKAPPSGISLLNEIFIITYNYFGLKLIATRLENEITKTDLSKEWLNELYIYKNKFLEGLTLIDNTHLEMIIDEKLTTYKEPKVPSIDVIAASKNIVQRNPFLRYIIRIFFYLLLAFILGLFYRLLD
ncbi:MAG: hypothetical protein JXA54_01375 [Candidatus Heimdallarchaeota archaeon]|nr:hypothetical protein [Candidatus Heimdallarchaeota archaeon]